MKNMIKRLRNERGLTLVELLAVIVILAIVAVIAFVFIGGIIDNSKKDAHIANAQQIISAAKLHEATGGTFPDAENGDVTVADLQNGDYLDEEMLDPWTKSGYDETKALNAKITIEDNGVFKITGFEASEKCNITATEQELSKEDRKDLCESGN